MTYNVFGGTLSLTQSINQSKYLPGLVSWQWAISYSYSTTPRFMRVLNENGFCNAKFGNLGASGEANNCWRNPQTAHPMILGRFCAFRAIVSLRPVKVPTRQSSNIAQRCRSIHSFFLGECTKKERIQKFTKRFYNLFHPLVGNTLLNQIQLKLASR